MIQEVNNLIDTYLKQERTIILAVIPSNVDIATVDILERAQSVRAWISPSLGGCCRVGRCVARRLLGLTDRRNVLLRLTFRSVLRQWVTCL